MSGLPRIALLNPNTNSVTTQVMTAIAAECAAGRALIDGRTVPFGPPIITTPAGLAHAAKQVVDTGRSLRHERFAGIIIAGFGDPGLADLRRVLDIPVTGIAEAGMAEAAAGGRRFSIVTTTPDLEQAIRETARTYGHETVLASVRITPGVAEVTMADPEGLAEALLCACVAAISEDGAAAIVIGGGPLALAARAIIRHVPVPLIEPVQAGARLAVRRCLPGAPLSPDLQP